MNAKSDIVTVGKGDDEKIYALSHSDITGWTIVGCMNMSELLRNSRQTRSIYVRLVAVGADHSCSSDFQPDCQKYYAADPEASRFHEKCAERKF
mgnify:CR=1 FL=1